MYNELSFLFNPMIMVSNSNKDTLYGEVSTYNKQSKNDQAFVVYKDYNMFKADGNIKNYIKEKIYDTESREVNPYIALLKDSNFQKGSKALKASDFTYLRDLGVYPINRLIVLRRYPEGVAVHDDLDKIGSQPISVIIGWIKEDAEIYSLSFSEEWGTSDKYLHEVIEEILTNEFKVGDMGSVIPQPGFTQGLMFGFLAKMGLTDPQNAYDIPFGDPNLLREAATRDYTKQGLKSDMSIQFETVYEQKIVGDFDPAAAMLDIIRNLATMGTSDTRYVFSGNSEILNKILNASSGKGNNVDAWAKVIQEIITKFTEAVSETVTSILGEIKPLTDEQKEQRKENEDKQKEEAEDAPAQTEAEKANADAAAEVGVFKSIAGQLETSAFLKSVLASTFAKHRWPLRASIAAMTGTPTAPWHITIGNPWSPIISAGNMVVDKIEVKAKGEMGFNDVPIHLNATITLKFGRNLGRQEILKIFNNGYKRIYKKQKPDTKK